MRAFIMLSLSLISCSFSYAATDSVSLKSDQVEELFAPARNAPGASLIIIQDGRVLHRKGYGMANLEHDVPNTPETKFRIGSITKSFTALAVLQLYDRGLLDISDHIIKYLPDIPNGDKITIRHILTHTSGIGESRDEQFGYAAGDRLNYSNQGYILLGEVIEKVSGKSYEEYLKENIFEPLSMLNSGYDKSDKILKHRASGYAIGGDGEFINAPYIDMKGPYSAGGLYSTAEDMYLLDQALYTDKTVKTTTLKEAFTPVKLNDGKEGVYGFGWIIGQQRGLKTVSHGGDISGFNSYILRFPDQRFTVIVLSNISMHPSGQLSNAGSLAQRIAEIYLADKMSPVSVREEVKVDPKIYDNYVGKYRLEAPQQIIEIMGDALIITREGDRLFAQDKQSKLEIFPESEEVFSARDLPAKIEFKKTDKGEVIGCFISLMGLREFQAKKIE